MAEICRHRSGVITGLRVAEFYANRAGRPGLSRSQGLYTRKRERQRETLSRTTVPLRPSSTARGATTFNAGLRLVLHHQKALAVRAVARSSERLPLIDRSS